MRQSLRIGISLLVLLIVGVVELGSGHSTSKGIDLSVIATAEARVGRPLTPVSYAGAARRTYRRCAVGVYNCY